MEVKAPTKLKRNQPCPCGSGRKYKKCCEKKEKQIMENPTTKTEVEKEAQNPSKGICYPEDVLIKRDQLVLLHELRFRSAVIQSNIANLHVVIAEAMAFREILLALPKSPHREVCLNDIDKIIDNNRANLKAHIMPASIKANIAALEELLQKPDAEDEEENEVREEGRNPVELDDWDEDDEAEELKDD